MSKQECVTRAICSNAGQSGRAEDLRRYQNFFVETLDTATLAKNTNQVLYGRRGSGKTLLLGTLDWEINTLFPKQKIRSFSFSAIDFRSTSGSDGPEVTIEQKTHAYFHAFIKQLCTGIVQLADDVLFTKQSWLKELTLSGESRAARRDALLEAVVHLIDAAGYGVPVVRMHDAKTLEELTREGVSGRSATLGVGAAVSSAANAEFLSAKGTFSAARGETVRLIEQHTLTRTKAFSPGRVRELLVQIVEMLGLDFIVISIDEWMTLNECQVSFAERLKQCLFGESRLSVKIAMDQYQGRLNNSGRDINFRGLEVGADIFYAIDLDQPFREEGRGWDLLARALYRRLLVFEPELTNYFGPDLAEPKYFIQSLFVNAWAFHELCRGANGICRDFFELFEKCSKKIGNSVLSRTRISVDTVWRVLIEEADEVFERAKRSSETRSLVFDVITPHVARQRSRYFVVDASSHIGITEVLKDLMTRRIIHAVPARVLHGSISGGYDCYELNYGVYTRLMRAAEFQTGEQRRETNDTEELNRIVLDTVKDYELDLSPMANQSKSLLCLNCSHEFLTTERSFSVAGLCPNCFMPHANVGES